MDFEIVDIAEIKVHGCQGMVLKTHNNDKVRGLWIFIITN